MANWIVEDIGTHINIITENDDTIGAGFPKRELPTNIVNQHNKVVDALEREVDMYRHDLGMEAKYGA